MFRRGTVVVVDGAVVVVVAGAVEAVAAVVVVAVATVAVGVTSGEASSSPQAAATRERAAPNTMSLEVIGMLSATPATEF